MTHHNNPALEWIRSQVRDAHRLLEGTLEGVTAEDAHWQPPGLALPIGATYAHVVLSEDGVVQGLFAGKTPLFAGEWAGRAGISELQPGADPAKPGFPDWSAWSRRVRVELTALRDYAQAVYAATDACLAGLGDADLDRKLDLSGLGLGEASLGFVVNNALLGNALTHCGEISCLKGLRGRRGYPV